MASLNYRCLTPNVAVEEHLVKADEMFFHEGAHFVIINDDGDARVCINNDASIYGWALVPQGRGAGSSDAYWKANSAGTSKIMVIVDEDARFLVPVDDTVDITNVGDAMDFIKPGTSDGSIQQMDLGETNQDVVRITGIGTKIKGGTTTDAIVKIFTWQADT